MYNAPAAVQITSRCLSEFGEKLIYVSCFSVEQTRPRGPIFHARFACIFETRGRKGGCCLAAAARRLRWFETVKSCRYSQEVLRRCQILCTIFIPITLPLFRFYFEGRVVTIWVHGFSDNEKASCVAICSLIRGMTEDAAQPTSFNQNITFVETELFWTQSRPHQMVAGWR